MDVRLMASRSQTLELTDAAIQRRSPVDKAGGLELILSQIRPPVIAARSQASQGSKFYSELPPQAF